jgi:hypothetical protein
VYPMLPVSLHCYCLVFLRLGYTRQRQTMQKQSRETGNIGYTRQRQTKQKQSRETGNMGYTRRRKTKQKQSRETGVCLRPVNPTFPVFLDCFCFVCLYLVYPMLPVS